jgi:aminopeptidase N
MDMLHASIPAALLLLGGVQVPTQLPRNVRPTHYDLAVIPDAGALAFRGRLTISIDVLEPTQSVTLNALDMTFHEVRLSGAGQPAFTAPKVAVDAGAQTATFTFGRPIPPGSYQLYLDYDGRIGTQAVGLFALDYDTPQGRKRGLFTQFENSDARRLIPSWDEPIYKATFNVEATLPKDELAVSNMPVVERQDLGDGRARVRFQPTPRMSTYLLFLAIGDLERATVKVGDTEVGVVTRRGATDQAAFALASSAEVLADYNEYFGRPYPLPKLDNVAAPGRSQFFGAMENWGAIASFEYILLLDPAISTEADRQAIFSVAAHEISHQWFGDLVTMAWWDDLWLNEGFASWMAGRTTQKLRPEWNTRLRAVKDRDKAMERDALSTTHPVVQHIETVEQASQAFDPITYEKGEAVIRMLEGYVGAEAWQKGVRSYIDAHAYGNTVSDDLWKSIEAAAGQPITAIAHEFTLQPGVPLITVSDVVCDGSASRVTLTQGQFRKGSADQAPLKWRVPVILQTLGASESVRVLVADGRASVSVPGCGPVVANAGQSGYYRTLYAPTQFARLASRFASLAPIDQLGLVTDTWALGRSGLQPASDVLELARATPVDADPQIWGRFATIFSDIDSYARGDAAGREAFRKFAIGRLAPVLARLSWTPRDGEPAQEAILRGELIEALGNLGDPAAVSEARRRYAAVDSEPAAIPGSLRKTILGVVARHADAATWERLRAAARAEKTPLIKDRLYALIASTVDESLARRALEVALSAEPGATNSAQMISQVAQEHPDLAFDFAMRHLAAVDAKVDPTSGSRYYARLAEESADPAMIAKLRAYAAAHLEETSRGETERVCASVSDRIRVREKALPLIDAWLTRPAS